MTLSRRAGLVGALVCAAGLPPAAGQDPRPARPFEAATTAIVVDVVVRDARGRPVTDLAAADFELYEDGVRQEIGDVTPVAAGGQPRQTPAPAGLQPRGSAVADGRQPRDVTASPLSAPTFVALVFDRLTPEGRALAYKGALAYLDTSHEGDFAGVFLSDLALVPIQSYTNDRTKLRAALQAVASRATSVFDRDSLKGPVELITQSAGDMHPMVPDVASAEFIGRPAELDRGRRRIGPGEPVPAIGGMQAYKASLFTFEQLARDQQGFASTNALRAVVSGLSMLPGRKTVVFFAEGLSLPEAVMPHFDGVVALANRANVSVYTMDAAGLRVHSKQRETTREVNAISAQSLVVNADGSTGGSLENMERLSMVLRTDPRTSLTLLAERTGGFLIENTNDLARGFRTIDADRRFHYLLTYTPKNPDFRGEWRKVEVRVPSRKVQVRSRTGYPAVRSLSTIPLLAYEGPALAALERTPAPAELPLRAAALQFPMADGTTRAAILVAAGGPTLRFEETAEGFRTDFTLLARVKDAGGQVVRKGSQPYRLTGPRADLARSRAGDVLFYRQPELPPGRYTVEAAVHDALAQKGGVTRVALEVPKAEGLRVSDLVVVSRTERLLSGELDASNPLQVGDRQIYPALGEPLRRTRRETVAFYVVVAGADPATTARLHVVRDGQTLAELPLALDAPDASGLIRQMSQIPAGGLGTGNFVLRLVVTKGAERVIREAAVRLEITG